MQRVQDIPSPSQYITYNQLIHFFNFFWPGVRQACWREQRTYDTQTR